MMRWLGTHTLPPGVLDILSPAGDKMSDAEDKISDASLRRCSLVRVVRRVWCVTCDRACTTAPCF